LDRIFNRDGTAHYKKAERPEITRIVQANKADALVGAYSGAMTPETLASYHRLADGGDIGRAMRAWADVIEKDLHLGSVLDTRKGAVVGCPWEIVPADDSDQAAKDADLVREIFEAIPDFSNTVRAMQDAVPYGFAFAEIMWAVQGRWIYVESIDEVMPHRLTFRGDNLDVLKYPRLLMTEMDFRGTEVPPEKFLFYRFQPRGGYVVRSGLMRGLSWWWLFQNYSIKDWVAFMEKFGQGFVLGRYDSAASAGDRRVLEEAVKNMATELAAMISKTTEIEIREFKGSATINMFDDFQRIADSYKSKRVIGQTLTTQEGVSGSLALGKVQGEVRQDILEYDCRGTEDVFNRGLVVPIVDFNFGSRDKYPKFKLKYEPPEDMKALVDVHKVLVVDMGVPVPLSYIRDTYGIPEPEEGEAILGGASPAPTKNQTAVDSGASAQFQAEGSDDIYALVGMTSPLLMELAPDRIRDILAGVGGKITSFEGDLLNMVKSRVSADIGDLLTGRSTTAQALDSLTQFFSGGGFRDPDSGEYTMDPRARAELYVRNEMKQIYRDTALENAKETYPDQKLYAFSRGPRDSRTAQDSENIEALTNWEHGGVPMPVDQYWAHPVVQAAHRPNDRGRDVIWPLRRFPEDVQRAIKSRYGA